MALSAGGVHAVSIRTKRERAVLCPHDQHAVDVAAKTDTALTGDPVGVYFSNCRDISAILMVLSTFFARPAAVFGDLL
jgi:hypothetical protein